MSSNNVNIARRFMLEHFRNPEIIYKMCTDDLIYGPFISLEYSFHISIKCIFHPAGYSKMYDLFSGSNSEKYFLHEELLLKT